MNSYPWMYRISDAPGLDTVHRSRLARFAADVCRRVSGIKCSYNTRRQSLLFHYSSEPDSGPMSVPAFGPAGPARFESHDVDDAVSVPAFGPAGPARFESHDVDDAVRFLNYGRIGRKLKDRIGRNNEAEEKYQAKLANEKFLDERRPSALDYAEWLDRRRRGTCKVIA